ncbi:MAG TPA: D-cysteine desulfhydrase family protein [Acidimicrobiales bacterium]|nr:D-cysteine desulfhydrase family protein [Acidimicrobiales bacterium]
MSARRVSFAPLPTPCEPMDRLGAELGFPSGGLLVKRDDLTALGGGGNKVRKLERLCADALEHDADTLVTGGGRQSNHVRMSAGAANRLGLACTVVLASDRPDTATGNVLLDELLGPEMVWAGDLDYPALEARIASEAERIRGEGRNPYVMPIGGASTIGALAYVDAAHELVAQVSDVDLVIVADGSGGTHAGLVAGLGDHGKVLGVDVGTRPDLDDAVPAMAADVASHAKLSPPAGTVQVDHDHFGDDYGDPTDACREALLFAARLEGIILDPVYTGKAMVALIAAAREGRIDPSSQRVVFMHTGGMPALFSSRYVGWAR